MRSIVVGSGGGGSGSSSGSCKGRGYIASMRRTRQMDGIQRKAIGWWRTGQEEGGRQHNVKRG
jgi:hypothetical protein